MPRTTSTKPDLAAQITEAVIQMLDAVTPEDFRCPWHRIACGRGLKPLNPLTGTVYRGINWLHLMMASGGGATFGITYRGPTYPSARWATYRQWLAAGCQVRAGEHGTGVVFFRAYQREVDKADGGKEVKEHRTLRTFTVFAAEQVEGAEGFLQAPVPAVDPTVIVPAAEQVLARSGADIRYGFNHARCIHMNDSPLRWIELPNPEQFIDQARFYATAFHELVHHTKKDVGRDAYLVEHFPDTGMRKAFEELVAELGAAMLCGATGIDNEPRIDHAAYVKSWLQALRSDRSFLMRAAAQAQVAVDHLLRRAGLAVDPGQEEAESPTAVDADHPVQAAA